MYFKFLSFGFHSLNVCLSLFEFDAFNFVLHAEEDVRSEFSSHFVKFIYYDIIIEFPNLFFSMLISISMVCLSSCSCLLYLSHTNNPSVATLFYFIIFPPRNIVEQECRLLTNNFSFN